MLRFRNFLESEMRESSGQPKIYDLQDAHERDHAHLPYGHPVKMGVFHHIGSAIDNANDTFAHNPPSQKEWDDMAIGSLQSNLSDDREAHPEVHDWFRKQGVKW